MTAKNLTLDDLTALVDGWRDDAKTEAIANADAQTSNAGLPTYSELVEALSATHQQLAAYLSTGYMSGYDKPTKDAHALLARIPS